MPRPKSCKALNAAIRYAEFKEALAYGDTPQTRVLKGNTFTGCDVCLDRNFVGDKTERLGHRGEQSIQERGRAMLPGEERRPALDAL